MVDIFNEEKYEKASKKALEFIKRQMDVNDFKYAISFAERYENDYSNNVMWGRVSGLSPDFEQIFPKYINVDNYYEYDYTGKVFGTWHGLSDYENYAVNVYIIQDTAYKVITCPLKANGTWESTMKYKETYTIPIKDPITGEETGETETKVETYILDLEVAKGIKEFRLAKNVSSRWEIIGSAENMVSERLVYDATNEIPVEEGGSVYSYFSFFTVNIYSYSDAEYLNDTCKIWNVGGGNYIWYTHKASKGHKIGKVMQQVWREGAFAYDVVGISGAKVNLQTGRLPASFLIPVDDPQYNKDGSNALGTYGYMLNSRTWAYDVGLALLVFTTSKDYNICKEMLDRMAFEQNQDGSFNFSYDIYIGQLFEGYVRTGAIGWLVWGACYYTLESGDRSYISMIKKAGEWMLSRQIIDKNDARYGLLIGGYGAYNMIDNSYIDGEIEWCSVEHQCSGLQALQGCSLVLEEDKYKKAAELVRDQLYEKCYDGKNGRFFQGVNITSIDKGWALDCTTWAGMLIFSILNTDEAKKCLETAKTVYLTKNKSIIQSTEKDYYNTTYSGEETFNGFKPYSDKTPDYAGAPDIVWTEGTLGYAALALLIGNTKEAKTYVDECIRLQECDGSSGGVIYTTATYGMLPWEFHVWESVVSSAWLYLIINNVDVLFPRSLRQVHDITQFVNIKDERK